MRLPSKAKKEIQRVIRDGWELSMGGKHYKLRRPGYGQVIISTSSSDTDIEHLIIRDIRKLEKK